jgi:hypothetical protein
LEWNPSANNIKKMYMDWLLKNFDKGIILPKLIQKDRNCLLVKWVVQSWNCINTKIVQNSFNFCGYGIPDGIDPKWKKYYKL